MVGPALIVPTESQFLLERFQFGRIHVASPQRHPGANPSRPEHPGNRTSGVGVSFEVTNLSMRVEQVALHVQLAHDDWGDVKLELRSPSGMNSVLAGPHSPAFDQTVNWTFTSVRHWGEPAFGTWTLNNADLRFLNQGEAKSVRLAIHGAVPAALAPSLAIRRVLSGVELTVSGVPGAPYVLENAAAQFDWQPLATLITTNGQATYRDVRGISLDVAALGREPLTRMHLHLERMLPEAAIQNPAVCRLPLRRTPTDARLATAPASNILGAWNWIWKGRTRSALISSWPPW